MLLILKGIPTKRLIVPSFGVAVMLALTLISQDVVIHRMSGFAQGDGFGGRDAAG